MPDVELEQAVAEFVMAFDRVFGEDWQYARLNFTCASFIRPGATFIEPGVTNEDDDWKLRGVLLKKYRHLVSILHERGISPIPPLPAGLERDQTAGPA